METHFLEVSQMTTNHPVKQEKNSYRIKYINVLEHFVQKYSKDDLWATEELHLYTKKLLDEGTPYSSHVFNFPKQFKEVISTKFKPFSFFSYRYCLLMDCIFLCAYENIDKGKEILQDFFTYCPKRYHKKLQVLFDFLFDPSRKIDHIEKIEYMKDCWEQNRVFLTQEPIKVIITANMSAGKSTLLNALVGKKVNKTQNDACTAKIHYIKNKPFEDSLCYEWDYLLDLDADHQTLMEDNQSNCGNFITVGTHFRTISPITKRLWLIDTPGVNSSRDIAHKQLAEDTILSSSADLMIYLLNGENIGTCDDRKHLIFISEHYRGNILFVVNKVDRFRKNEDSVHATLQTLTNELIELGFASPMVVPISSYAAYLAKMKIAGEILDEDEQDEFNRLARKLKQPEYQFNSYYPDSVQSSVNISCDTDTLQLLMHSGVLHLEHMIYTIR